LLEKSQNINTIKLPKSNVKSHLTFWVLLIFLLVFLSNNRDGISSLFVMEAINVSFFAMIVYLNIYYIFPNYIKQKNLAKHLTWLLLASAMITPIKALLLFNMKQFFDISYNLENQFFIFLGTFFVVVLSTIYSILKDWIHSQNEKQELVNQQLQSELKFLKSQINPHFLFNTLNSLYALTLKKSDLAPEVVLKLSEMMRYMLYECNEKSVPLEKEVNYLINYLELEKVRHGKKIKINFNQSGEITNQEISPLMFIPFVENCFKHGVSNQIAEAFVDINLMVEKKSIEIHIENSKHAAMPGVISKKSGGIGLINVKRRLDLLYPNAYNIEVLDTPITYKVILKINLT
jgi:two-component system, LytTR family, sensor kinase